MHTFMNHILQNLEYVAEITENELFIPRTISDVSTSQVDVPM